MRNYGEDAHTYATLQKCQGDCDADSHCADGLKCFQRKKGEQVPGCLAGIGETLSSTLALALTLTFTLQVPGCLVGGDGDVSGNGYCYDAKGTQCD